MLRKYKNPMSVGAVLIAVFIILGLALPTSTSNIMARILVMMLFATGVNIMFGYTGLVAFGQGIFFGGAAYAYVLLVVKLGMNQWLAFLLTVAGTTLASVLIGKLCLRVQAFTFALLFMGLNILAYNIAVKVPALGSGSGIAGSVRPQGFTSTKNFFFLALGIVIVCYIIIYIIMHSPLGKIAQGLRENEERLTFLGINTKSVKLMMIVLSSFFCAIAGILYSMLNLGAFTSYLNVLISQEGLIMCLVGGMFCFWGPTLGAVLITFVTVYVAGLTTYYNCILGVILIVAIIFFPSGLLGQDKNSKHKAGRLIGKIFNEDSFHA